MRLSGIEPRMLSWLLLCALPATGMGQFDDVADGLEVIRREHYLILSAENTSLQNFLLGQPAGTHNYVTHLLVDGQAVDSDGRVDLELIDWSQLGKDLRSNYASQLRRQVDNPPKRSLLIQTFFTGNFVDEENLLNWTLEGCARQSARFEAVKVTSHYSSGGQGLWDKFNAIIGDYEELVDYTANEAPKENEYVAVYPVRTFFSRIQTSNADCVVVIKPKFSKDFEGQLPRSIRTSMSVFGRQLKFDKKRKVLFSMKYSSRDGEEAKEWFIKSGSREMTLLLGFQTSSVAIGYQ